VWVVHELAGIKISYEGVVSMIRRKRLNELSGFRPQRGSNVPFDHPEVPAKILKSIGEEIADDDANRLTDLLNKIIGFANSKGSFVFIQGDEEMITSMSAKITLYFAKTGRETDNDDEEFRSLCQGIGSYIKKMPHLRFALITVGLTASIEDYSIIFEIYPGPAEGKLFFS
jgi:hypothetical protein